ncbi:MAG: hypothetical protein WBP90_18775, partial [Terracidiphilus sp.]
MIILRRVRAWTPARQPDSHPKKQRPFLGDPGLESGATLHPADQQFALVDHLWRQVIVHVDEQFLVA